MCNDSVCADCFDDYAIREFISANLTVEECSYCGKVEDEPIAAWFDDVADFIEEGLSRTYCEAAECLPYETAEGGYQCAPVLDSYDVFENLGVDRDGGALFDDLVTRFQDWAFVDGDPFVLSDREGMNHLWTRFCRLTKHKTRFVFFNEGSSQDEEEFHPDAKWTNSSPSEILELLGELVFRFGLIKNIELEHLFFRAQLHSADEFLTDAHRLGSPPVEKAKQNRMTPAGISHFYAGDCPRTAIKEIVDASDENLSFVTTATFKANRPLRIADFTRLPDLPSIFDQRRFDEIQRILFLQDFRKDISKPITNDDRVHYEYVPTQIVTEYLKNLRQGGEDAGIDGIAFPSSKHKGGICYCLFFSNDDFRSFEPDSPLQLIDTYREPVSEWESAAWLDWVAI